VSSIKIITFAFFILPGITVKAQQKIDTTAVINSIFQHIGTALRQAVNLLILSVPAVIWLQKVTDDACNGLK
jgi:hypothetical protein